jgi:integrase
MPRSARSTNLETRTARLKLAKQKEPYWVRIRPGLFLGYYRPTGTWWVRERTQRAASYTKAALATADDHQDADGAEILTFYDAQDAARRWSEHRRKGAGKLTVADACKDYMAWFRQHRKSADRTQQTIDAHILPSLGKNQVDKLTVEQLRHWHETIATTPRRLRTKKGETKQAYAEAPSTETEKRQRRSSANRCLTVLKAALNHAAGLGKAVPEGAWKRVKPFRAVDEARVRFLSPVERKRLVNASRGALRDLVRAALLTGARYGELTRAQVRDYDGKRLFVAESKSGKPRHIPLTSEGRGLFDRLAAQREQNALLLTKDDGTLWGRGHAARPLRHACGAAGVDPVAFHELRHSYASTLAQAGMTLQEIAHLLGHSDTRITHQHYAHLCDDGLAKRVEDLLGEVGGEDEESNAVRLSTTNRR